MSEQTNRSKLRFTCGDDVIENSSSHEQAMLRWLDQRHFCMDAEAHLWDTGATDLRLLTSGDGEVLFVKHHFGGQMGHGLLFLTYLHHGYRFVMPNELLSDAFIHPDDLPNYVKLKPNGRPDPMSWWQVWKITIGGDLGKQWAVTKFSDAAFPGRFMERETAISYAWNIAKLAFVRAAKRAATGRYLRGDDTLTFHFDGSARILLKNTDNMIIATGPKRSNTQRPPIHVERLRKAAWRRRSSGGNC